MPPNNTAGVITTSSALPREKKPLECPGSTGSTYVVLSKNHLYDSLQSTPRHVKVNGQHPWLNHCNVRGGKRCLGEYSSC